MNILLININPVVSRLISLCLRDGNMVLEEVTDVNAVKHDRYEIVFVDDASYVEGIKETLSNFMIRKKVFLSGKNVQDETLDYFDEVIYKPFLPSQITTVIESLNEIENDTEEVTEEHFIFPLATEEMNVADVEEDDSIEFDEVKETNVLDGSEIERIKALLEEDALEIETVEPEDEVDYETRKVEVITQHLEADGLEIVREEEYVEALSKKRKKDKKKKSAKKKEKKQKEETFTFEEALIAAVEGMKVKKIKKLLKGAEVTIKINFKDKTNGKS